MWNVSCCGGGEDALWARLPSHLMTSLIIKKGKYGSSTVTNNEKRLFDTEDHSWTRTEPELMEAFAGAQLEMVQKTIQTGFPKEIFPVKIFALKPIGQQTTSTEDD